MNRKIISVVVFVSILSACVDQSEKHYEAGTVYATYSDDYAGIGNYLQEYPAEIDENYTASSWIDLGGISIPPEWSYTIHLFGPSTTGYFFVEGANDPLGVLSWILIDIFGESVSGTIHMALKGLLIIDPFTAVAEFFSQQGQDFSFNNGSNGYVLKNPSFLNDTLFLWSQHGTSLGLSLFYDGDDSVFTENEELILKIARTLTPRHE